VTTLLEHGQRRVLDRETLEAYSRDLTRAVLSIICTTTGRQRTPDERARLDALVREIHRVRSDLRAARLPA
jgi:hypothetical protein